MLSEYQKLTKINSVYFSQDGTVTIELNDKRKFKLSAQYWIDLNHPREGILSESQLEELESENNYTQIREKVLNLLSTREHSVFELQRKVKQSLLKSRIVNFSALFDRCMIEMKKKDFQSDERFTRHFVKSKIENKLQGPFMILQDLHNRGISHELSKAVLDEITDQELWMKKAIECLGYFHKKNKKIFDQSFSQKLYQRGFPWEIIQQAMEKFESDCINLNI